MIFNMDTSSLVFMLLVEGSVTATAAYLFYKMLKKK